MFVSEPERPFEASDPSAGRDGPAPPRETFDERLNAILEAATTVIARDGYGSASMRAVAKAANVSLSGLYHYFESKERMLFLIQFRTFTSLLNNLKERLHGVEEPEEQLRVMVRAHVGYFAANLSALKVCSHELDSLSGAAYDETRRIRSEYYALTRSIVDRLMAKFAPDSPVDQHVATMSLFGMLNWLYRWYTPGPGRSPSGLANQLASLFLSGTVGVPVSDSSGVGRASEQQDKES
jgi:TetR/AcrR family transcriptional regulator, cholesterol catabolism regulator